MADELIVVMTSQVRRVERELLWEEGIVNVISHTHSFKGHFSALNNLDPKHRVVRGNSLGSVLFVTLSLIGYEDQTPHLATLYL